MLTHPRSQTIKSYKPPALAVRFGRLPATSMQPGVMLRLSPKGYPMSRDGLCQADYLQ